MLCRGGGGVFCSHLPSSPQPFLSFVGRRERVRRGKANKAKARPGRVGGLGWRPRPGAALPPLSKNLSPSPFNQFSLVRRAGSAAVAIGRPPGGGKRMGRIHLVYLDGKMYSCKHCRTHLALYEDIVSKSFQCKHGKAYLFSKAVNVSVGQKEERLMMTGMHTVADIFCVGCGSIVGWKYLVAHERSQKYKEGKFILERFKVLGPDGGNYWVSHEAQVSGSVARDS